MRNGKFFQIYSCTESWTIQSKRNTRRMKKIKKMREHSVQELKMLVQMTLDLQYRTVEKYGARSRLKLMRKMMEAARNGQKVIHRTNIFEEIVFILY